MVPDTELKNLRVQDIALEGDPRILVPEGRALILLREPKAGRDQWVSVRDPCVIVMLRWIIKGRPPRHFIFSPIRDVMLPLLARAQGEMGYASPIFVMHSLRHGGACYDFLSSRCSFEQIKIRGRWSDFGITKRYLQESQARLLSASMQVEVKHRVQYMISHPNYLWSLLGASVVCV